MCGCRRVHWLRLQVRASSYPPRAPAAARRPPWRVRLPLPHLRTSTSHARRGASTLWLVIHAARTSHDDAIDEQEHPHGQQQMDPAGRCRREGDNRPNYKHQDAQNQQKVHGENSLTQVVTTGMFRQSLGQLLHQKISVSSLGRGTHFLSQQVLRVGSINYADVMPQCGEGDRQGEDLIHSIELQTTSPSHY